MFSPATFQIGYHKDAVASSQMPTIEHVTEFSLSFATHWKRLDQLIFEGPKSFPVLPGRKFGLTECLLRRDATRRGRITFKLVSILLDGTEVEEFIDEKEVISRLTGRRCPERKKITLVTSVEV